MIDDCFKEDRSQTRAKVRGQPLAIRAEWTPFLNNSFVPRTTPKLNKLILEPFYLGRSPLPPGGGLETLFELEKMSNE